MIWLPNFLIAGFPIRLVSYLIDLLVVKSIWKLVLIPLGLYFDMTYSKAFLSPYIIAYSLTYLSYFILATWLLKGQTLGKIVTGLRVVFLGGDEGLKAVIFREGLGRFVLLRYPFLYLTSIFLDNHRHIGDFFADSLVVREKAMEEYIEIFNRLPLESEPENLGENLWEEGEIQDESLDENQEDSL